MALTNFVLTVAGLSAVLMLTRSDVKHSAAIFRRNVKQIRNWLEEESASAANDARSAAKLLKAYATVTSSGRIWGRSRRHPRAAVMLDEVVC
ncbi:hypothetical protein QQ045_001674 [Rhodiola kirilowii]